MITNNSLVACPSCTGEMRQSHNTQCWSCDNCGFLVSMLEAYQFGARSPQEAANIKASILHPFVDVMGMQR